MLNDFEKIVREIYRQHKAKEHFTASMHPTDVALACFLDDLLPTPDKDLVIKHLLGCAECAEALRVQLEIPAHLSLDVPLALLEKIKKTVAQEINENFLEIILRLKAQVLEIVQTTGDVLLGQELVPAPVLRSRKISEFKDEINILKDLQQTRVMVKIASKSNSSFNLTVTVLNKYTLKQEENLRVTLLKDGLELESYAHDCASSFFENIKPGDYIVEVTRQGKNESIIDLKVKV